jgi:two-component system, cell cycle sensor histidine kinase and response regulator CckA
VVITEVVMPTLSGPELAQAIHRRRPGVPIVFTSGCTAGVLGDRTRLPADAVIIEKPFSRMTLPQTVDAVLHPAPPSAA